MEMVEDDLVDRGDAVSVGVGQPDDLGNLATGNSCADTGDPCADTDDLAVFRRLARAVRR